MKPKALLFQGEFRLRIPFSDVKSLEVRRGTMRVGFSGGQAAFDLDLSRADLRAVDFSDAHLSRLDLSGVDLGGVDLGRAGPATYAYLTACWLRRDAVDRCAADRPTA